MVIALAGTTPAPAGRQVIATFVLRVNGAVGRSPVAVSGTVFDGRGMELAATDVAAPAAIASRPTGLVGDLAGTGLPSVGSALKIMRVADGLDAAPPASDLWRWDANGNGLRTPTMRHRSSAVSPAWPRGPSVPRVRRPAANTRPAAAIDWSHHGVGRVNLRCKRR